MHAGQKPFLSLAFRSLTLCCLSKAFWSLLALQSPGLRRVLESGRPIVKGVNPLLPPEASVTVTLSWKSRKAVLWEQGPVVRGILPLYREAPSHLFCLSSWQKRQPW